MTTLHVAARSITTLQAECGYDRSKFLKWSCTLTIENSHWVQISKEVEI